MRKKITTLFVAAIASYASVHAQTFNYTGSLQNITVPACTDSVTIEAYGAQGGGDIQDAAGGMGAKIVGTFKVTPNHVLAIMVGGQGLDDVYNGFGGGGGSFVWDSSMHDTLMIAAGGGGGAGVDNSGSVGGPGSATTTPTTGWNGAYTAAGGVGGNGGDSGTNGTGQYAGGGGGAGWYSNGFDGQVGSSSNPSGHGGVRPLAGGAGGTAAANWGAAGGYGGGGGSGIDGGGGGGYNGGGGSNAYPIGGTSGSGGGGGSFNGGVNQTNVAGFQSGDGMVVITFISTTHDLSPVLGADSACQGSTFLYTCTHYAGASFTWTAPAGSVVTSGQGTDSAMITFGGTTGFVKVVGNSACGNDMDSIHVIVTPLPAVTMHATTDSLCKDITKDSLIGSPLGGTFSGAGVTGANFNPNAAGVGNHVIHYTFTNAQGCTSSDSTVVVVNNCITGVTDQNDIRNQVSMYPNPFSQSLTVNVAVSGQVNISIFNLLGETVASCKVDKGTHTINTESLPAGVYSVRIETPQGGLLTQKLVKIQ